jgi:ribose transport system ATP-binding protein
VLKDGATVATVERTAVDHDGLVALMVGRAVELAYPPRGEDFGAVRLAVEGFTAPDRFHEVSFTVRAGEILGLGGIQGNGQSDVPRALFGLMQASGSVMLDGDALACASPRASIRDGVVYVPGDRHAEGLFMPHSIRQNIALPHVAGWTHMGLLSGAREANAVEAAMKRFAVKANDAPAATSKRSCSAAGPRASRACSSSRTPPAGSMLAPSSKSTGRSAPWQPKARR